MHSFCIALLQRTAKIESPLRAITSYFVGLILYCSHERKLNHQSSFVKKYEIWFLHELKMVN